MKNLFNVYRVLALVVGVLLVVGAVGSLLKWGHHVVDAAFWREGTSLHSLGEDLSVVWEVHGIIYMVYLVVAFVLTQKARWTLTQFGLMLVAGLVPGLIFWVERRVAAQLRAEYPELSAA